MISGQENPDEFSHVFDSKYLGTTPREDHDLWIQYLYALRFATGMVVNSDSGIQPGFWAERVFVIIMMLFSFVVCSGAISMILTMFHRLTAHRAAQDELLWSFKEYMVAGRVPLSLQIKIKRYLEFQFQSQKTQQAKRNDMLEKLSPWLRKELLVHLNKGVIMQHQFFASMNKDILTHACCMVRNVLYAPGDVVLMRGQVEPCIYFVVRGRLSVARTDEQASTNAAYLLRSDDRENLDGSLAKAATAGPPPGNLVEGLILREHGYICASSLFDVVESPYTITSVDHSELLAIPREDINELRVEFPSFDEYCERWIQKEGMNFHDSSLDNRLFEELADAKMPRRQRPD
eukprot:gnl/TRDRNA2_/TRDRNA2_121468_c0_seq1.p1 gnl/TRDRNA2_/TRDRNA2_121468_c0~~gnl/TRDRNA2_/TRDRNA2_121468_c0_seq1.p1  ORF type:complete len:347 (-),score=59.59 gnl/TRDRNA2_/TRDRNA2_121468_c0_seq1:101-1141(-)